MTTEHERMPKHIDFLGRYVLEVIKEYEAGVTMSLRDFAESEGIDLDGLADEVSGIQRDWAEEQSKS